MNITHNHQKIILASKSPRRRDLLKQAGLQFSVVPSTFNESSVNIDLIETPEMYVSILAQKKTKPISKAYPSYWVIGADTIVLFNEKILEKPASKKEAYTMLKRLSGNIHEVFTGYAVFCQKEQCFFTNMVKTKVTFKSLSDSEIKWYIHTNEPFDKAGAYGIQGLGTFLVKSVNGSYTNVVGLPICEIMDFLIQKHVITIN